VCTAYRWLLESGYAPEQIAFAGDSTGAMLVLSALVAARDRGLPMPRAAVLLCPAVDVYMVDTPTPDQQLHRYFRTAYLAGRPWADPEANPMFADLAGLPPILIQSGARDGLGLHTRDLIARLESAAVPVRHDAFDVDGHAFQIFWSFHPEAAEALRRAGEFLRRGGAT
jgi:acetyl esterase/lipase